MHPLASNAWQNHMVVFKAAITLGYQGVPAFLAAVLLHTLD